MSRPNSRPQFRGPSPDARKHAQSVFKADCLLTSAKFVGWKPTTLGISFEGTLFAGFHGKPTGKPQLVGVPKRTQHLKLRTWPNAKTAEESAKGASAAAMHRREKRKQLSSRMWPPKNELIDYSKCESNSCVSQSKPGTKKVHPNPSKEIKRRISAHISGWPSAPLLIFIQARIGFENVAHMLGPPVKRLQ